MENCLSNTKFKNGKKKNKVFEMIQVLKLKINFCFWILSSFKIMIVLMKGLPKGIY